MFREPKVVNTSVNVGITEIVQYYRSNVHMRNHVLTVVRVMADDTDLTSMQLG